MIPLTRGVGISMNLINNWINVYYIMIIGYSLYYLILSLNSSLPWERCDPKWASVKCVDDFSKDKFTFNECNESSMLLIKCSNGQCYTNTTLPNNTQVDYSNCDRLNSTLYSVGYWE
jgi:hypothetical protein